MNLHETIQLNDRINIKKNKLRDELIQIDIDTHDHIDTYLHNEICLDNRIKLKRLENEFHDYFNNSQ